MTEGESLLKQTADKMKEPCPKCHGRIRRCEWISDKTIKIWCGDCNCEEYIHPAGHIPGGNIVSEAQEKLERGELLPKDRLFAESVSLAVLRSALSSAEMKLPGYQKNLIDADAAYQAAALELKNLEAELQEYRNVIEIVESMCNQRHVRVCREDAPNGPAKSN